MLLSELEERERRFKLALRAGIPIILLISLIFYALFFRDKTFDIDTETTALFLALVFITVYFIYFLMELAIKESLIDRTTQGFTEGSFIKRLEKFGPKTLVLLVIENLSTLNEHYSSEKVDRILYDMVHYLNDYLRERGYKNILIARRYGAEFLIAFDRDDPEIETVLHAFCKAYRKVDEIELDLVFSLLTNISDDIKQDVRILKDLLHIQSKHNPLATYDVDLKDARKAASVEYAISEALKKELLELTFRPIRNAHTDKIEIYEVSVKLRAEDGSIIQPKIFLPIINRLGLGTRYDMVLFKRLLTLLPLTDSHVSFSFNLSPFSLRNEPFRKEFFERLETSGVEARRLIIELYERKTHHDLSGYLETLRRFRTRGVRIAIDNFGSSNASMEYMKHFHFDFIQFDREYVTRLDDIQTKAMLNSLIQMAKELEIKTIAKWVDKTEQKRELVAMGIDYLQGYGIAKPLKENELLKIYNP
jgi:EAL domain-containing protein (putative c-di-GMP-specific phosphodiesterase class I)/GGDEF domain-containing protein